MKNVLFALSFALVGCGGAGASADDDDVEDDDGGDDGADCEVAPGRVGLQRLTRSEYNRTVRDLFGITSTPADTFPPDSTTSSFDNNARSLTVSPQLMELLLDAAEDVAAEAMTVSGGGLVACDPEQDPQCARTTLSTLALKVYRRPATDTELDDLLELVSYAQSEGEEFEAAIEHALIGMLVSPQFLYRNVPGDGTAPLGAGQIIALDDYEVASRLSYFLWGSTPDAALLARASEGMLRERETLRAEFDRMLADPKSTALYEGFFTQWLQLGKLDSVSPNPESFPQFTEELRAEMAEETRLFFKSMQDRDASMLEVVNGTQTYANEAIAALYGVTGATGPTGPWFVPMDTDPTQRAGVLTMPAILAMTSGPDNPNIVKRGVWLAEAILCAAPPPPAEGVPTEPVPLPGETERERLERHRTDPVCASCHELIDPLGFSLESYDVLGRWREEVDGEPVDNLGRLPDGTTFSGAVELAELLTTGDQYSTCVTRKLMTYAVGRTMGSGDQCVISAIAEQRVTPDSTLSDLLWAVVTSDAFMVEEMEDE